MGEWLNTHCVSLFFLLLLVATTYHRAIASPQAVAEIRRFNNLDPFRFSELLQREQPFIVSDALLKTKWFTQLRTAVAYVQQQTNGVDAWKVELEGLILDQGIQGCVVSNKPGYGSCFLWTIIAESLRMRGQLEGNVEYPGLPMLPPLPYFVPPKEVEGHNMLQFDLGMLGFVGGPLDKVSEHTDTVQKGAFSVADQIVGEKEWVFIEPCSSNTSVYDTSSNKCANQKFRGRVKAGESLVFFPEWVHGTHVPSHVALSFSTSRYIPFKTIEESTNRDFKTRLAIIYTQSFCSPSELSCTDYNCSQINVKLQMFPRK